MAKNYPDYDDLREQYEAGNISAVDLGMIAVTGAMEKIGLDSKYVDEVILGNVLKQA